MVVFEGSAFFRQRVLLATLSGKSLTIKKIRNRDQNPGLRGKEQAEWFGFVAR